MKGYFYQPYPLGGMIVHSMIIPSIKFACTHLHTWVETDTVRVKCPAQEHSALALKVPMTWKIIAAYLTGFSKKK